MVWPTGPLALSAASRSTYTGPGTAALARMADPMVKRSPVPPAAPMASPLCMVRAPSATSTTPLGFVLVVTNRPRLGITPTNRRSGCLAYTQPTPIPKSFFGKTISKDSQATLNGSSAGAPGCFAIVTSAANSSLRPPGICQWQCSFLASVHALARTRKLTACLLWGATPDNTFGSVPRSSSSPGSEMARSMRGRTASPRL